MSGAEMLVQECFIYQLKDGCGPRYDQLHAEVWPEVQQSLREAGMVEYSIYRRDELVITVLSRRAERLADKPAVSAEVERRLSEWTATLAPLFKQVVDDDGQLLYAPRVFRL